MLLLAKPPAPPNPHPKLNEKPPAAAPAWPSSHAAHLPHEHAANKKMHLDPREMKTAAAGEARDIGWLGVHAAREPTAQFQMKRIEEL